MEKIPNYNYTKYINNNYNYNQYIQNNKINTEKNINLRDSWNNKKKISY